MNDITLVVDENNEYEWLYINSNQVTTGEPIDASVWLDIISKYQPFEKAERFALTEEFIDRVNGNLQLVPKNLKDFEKSDLIRI